MYASGIELWVYIGMYLFWKTLKVLCKPRGFEEFSRIVIDGIHQYYFEKTQYRIIYMCLINARATLI